MHLVKHRYVVERLHRTMAWEKKVRACCGAHDTLHNGRGGMIHGEENSQTHHEEHAAAAWKDDMQFQQPSSMGNPSTRRSRSQCGSKGSTSPTARTCLMNGPTSPYEHLWKTRDATGPYSDKDVEKKEPLPVLVVDGEHRVGYVWAPPDSPVNDVVQEFKDTLILESIVDITPAMAKRWKEVARLHLHGQTVSCLS